MCGEYKITVNTALNIDDYPLPNIEENFSSLGGGEYFSKIDFKNAYLQVGVIKLYLNVYNSCLTELFLV